MSKIANSTKTVVFVTGAWMHTSSWDKFRSAFEAAGYTTYAPAWPYLEGKPAELRANPDKRLGKLTFKQIVDTYAAFIDTLELPDDEKARLRAMTPAGYTGLAAALAHRASRQHTGPA